jgi:hypothetical protein
MRPSDWASLGLAHDPTPGDPVVVREGGRKYTTVADAIARAAASLRGLEAGASNVDSVKALLESRDTIVENVSKAEGRYRTAGSALTTYATVLDRVQSETAAALHAAKAAAGDGADAGSQQAKYHQMAQDAEDAGDAEEQDKYAKKEKAAQEQASHAAGAVSAQKAVVHQAVADRDKAAQTAIDSIKQITANDGLNDGWWEDWGADLFKVIADIAEKAAAVLGILALLLCWVPILGEVLMVLAAVAGIVAAVANIALAIGGEKSWGEAALSVVFAALGCIGLGAAARAGAGAFKLMMSQAGRIAAGQGASRGARLTMALLLRPGALSRVSRGGVNNVKGALGEEIMGVKAYVPKAKFSVTDPSTGAVRLGAEPDWSLKIFNKLFVADAKNVASISNTVQMREYANLAAEGGTTFRLVVSEATKVSSTLTSNSAVKILHFEDFLGTRIGAMIQAPAAVGNGVLSYQSSGAK